MYDLSVLIPARNEEWLARTIQDILEHRKCATEVIAVLDGEWADPALDDHPDVTVIYHPESIGQRAATNEAARIASAKWVMKCDAHCAFDEGFDEKMLAAIDGHPDWTMAPLMKNLHVFNWVCDVDQSHIRYQSPSGPCETCGATTHKECVWIAKKSPNSTAYLFDPSPHFQYFNEFRKRPEGQGPISPSMSLQGSCFMLSRERYLDLNICDESWGSWGSQGIEVACKSWLSGGAVMINQQTWYAHCFRTQGSDFGFPYELSGKQVEHAKRTAKGVFFNNEWHRQVRPLSWLLEKFWPVPGWSEEQLKEQQEMGKAFYARTRVFLPSESKIDTPTKGIIYYSDCQLDPAIAEAVRANLGKISQEKNIPIVSATLKRVHFGQKNICFPHFKRSPEAMFKQIKAALEHSDSEIIYFTEHDCLYPPDHFDFIPPEQDKFYYNTNFWKVRLDDGHAVHFDACQTSGLVAYRELLLAEYSKIIEQVERDGFSVKSVSYEPGSRDGRAEKFQSALSIIDIRHGNNLTPSRWSQNQFRDQSTCQNWQEAESVPGWYEKGKFNELLKGAI